MKGLLDSPAKWLSRKMGSRVFLVDILAVLFGISSWICINGMWVEMPLLVNDLPEGWNLSSYVTVIVQVANVGPILYGVLSRVWPNVVRESVAVYFILFVGLVSNVLLVFFWNVTRVVGGEEHSVAFLSLTFLMAIVDCTSSVLYMPFMALYEKKYLTSLMVGEGLSGFLPSVLSLVQGIGGNAQCRNVSTFDAINNVTTYAIEQYTPPALFSVQDFFWFLVAMMVASGAAFFLLNNLNAARVARVQPDCAVTLLSDVDKSSSTNDHHHMSTRTLVILLCLQTWICTLANGVFTSISSYSTLPYGNNAYHLSSALAAMASPVVYCIAFFLPVASLATVGCVTAAGTIVSCYIMATAVLSPSPPLMDQEAGGVLVVVAWVLYTALFAYGKISIATILRRNKPTALFWAGVFTQLGSFTGSVVMFFTINYGDVFHSYTPC